MTKKIIEIKIDKSSFNATHFAGESEDNFILHEFASVPDSYGSDEKKIEFLKEAYSLIQKAVS